MNNVTEAAIGEGEKKSATSRMLLSTPDYRRYLVARTSSVIAGQIQSVALGWQVYNLARRTQSVDQSAFTVGMLGFAAFFPVLLLTLPAGEAADRHDRIRIIQITLAGQIALSASVALLSWLDVISITGLIAMAAGIGAFRSYYNPASQALGPTIVPRELLPRAVAWNSLCVQVARTLGPGIGGLLVALSPAGAYAAAAVILLIAVGAFSLIKHQRDYRAVHLASRWHLMREGLNYVLHQRVLLGAISMDLFAVLLGGATALLPVFSKDILHLGPESFGLLRASQAAGAVVTAVALTVVPIHRRAGAWMFAGVFVFGAMTAVFSLSRLLWLSCLALVIVGAADMISVYVRQTIIQITTPDALRGRVASVSSLFIGASNELGEFETGVVARFTGPIIAALSGGIMSIAVAAGWAIFFPELRKADRLDRNPGDR